MSDREAKRRRVLELRDGAIDLVTAYGRIEGNIDFRGQLTRVRSWEEGRLHIELWSPRHPSGIDRGEKRPTTNILTVRFAGEIKLKLGWDGERLNLIRFEPGAWEGQIC